MNASDMVVEYLQEARASEDALVRVLQSQIAMTPSGSYRTGLEAHLKETRDHSARLAGRIKEISGSRTPMEMIAGIADSLVGQGVALAKTPLDALRGSGGEEKVLKNARDAAASEALEIATYTAIERLAESVGDDRTRELAQSIRAQEQKMLDRILEEIPALTDAVARAQLADDPSYDVSKTGAAETARDVADTVSNAATRAKDAARRTARQARKVPGVARAEGEVKGAVADASDLAIAGYDELTVEEISSKLTGLSQIDLAKVHGYERRHENRKGVLERVDALKGGEPWPGYDELTVADIQSVLTEGDEERIGKVRDYESSHKNRAGVLRAVDKALAKP